MHTISAFTGHPDVSIFGDFAIVSPRRGALFGLLSPFDLSRLPPRRPWVVLKVKGMIAPPPWIEPWYRRLGAPLVTVESDRRFVGDRCFELRTFGSPARRAGFDMYRQLSRHITRTQFTDSYVNWSVISKYVLS